MLNLNWMLPYSGKDIESQPLNYFAFLFGHEGENSLLSYLKSEGLATNLATRISHELHSFDQFTVEVTLTRKGLQDHEKVIEAIFKYAKIIKEAGI
jgi:insulysin